MRRSRRINIEHTESDNGETISDDSRESMSQENRDSSLRRSSRIKNTGKTENNSLGLFENVRVTRSRSSMLELNSKDSRRRERAGSEVKTSPKRISQRGRRASSVTITDNDIKASSLNCASIYGTPSRIHKRLSLQLSKFDDIKKEKCKSMTLPIIEVDDDVTDSNMSNNTTVSCTGSLHDCDNIEEISNEKVQDSLPPLETQLFISNEGKIIEGTIVPPENDEKPKTEDSIDMTENDSEIDVCGFSEKENLQNMNAIMLVKNIWSDLMKSKVSPRNKEKIVGRKSYSEGVSLVSKCPSKRNSLSVEIDKIIDLNEGAKHLDAKEDVKTNSEAIDDPIDGKFMDESERLKDNHSVRSEENSDEFLSFSDNLEEVSKKKEDNSQTVSEEQPTEGSAVSDNIKDTIQKDLEKGNISNGEGIEIVEERGNSKLVLDDSPKKKSAIPEDIQKITILSPEKIQEFSNMLTGDLTENYQGNDNDFVKSDNNSSLVVGMAKENEKEKENSKLGVEFCAITEEEGNTGENSTHGLVSDSNSTLFLEKNVEKSESEIESEERFESLDMYNKEILNPDNQKIEKSVTSNAIQDSISSLELDPMHDCMNSSAQMEWNNGSEFKYQRQNDTVGSKSNNQDLSVKDEEEVFKTFSGLPEISGENNEILNEFVASEEKSDLSAEKVKKQFDEEFPESAKSNIQNSYQLESDSRESNVNKSMIEESLKELEISRSNESVNEKTEEFNIQNLEKSLIEDRKELNIEDLFKDITVDEFRAANSEGKCAESQEEYETIAEIKSAQSLENNVQELKDDSSVLIIDQSITEIENEQEDRNHISNTEESFFSVNQAEVICDLTEKDNNINKGIEADNSVIEVTLPEKIKATPREEIEAIPHEEIEASLNVEENTLENNSVEALNVIPEETLSNSKGKREIIAPVVRNIEILKDQEKIQYIIKAEEVDVENGSQSRKSPETSDSISIGNNKGSESKKNCQNEFPISIMNETDNGNEDEESIDIDSAMEYNLSEKLVHSPNNVIENKFRLTKIKKSVDHEGSDFSFDDEELVSDSLSDTANDNLIREQNEELQNFIRLMRKKGESLNGKAIEKDVRMSSESEIREEERQENIVVEYNKKQSVKKKRQHSDNLMWIIEEVSEKRNKPSIGAGGFEEFIMEELEAEKIVPGVSKYAKIDTTMRRQEKIVPGDGYERETKIMMSQSMQKRKKKSDADYLYSRESRARKRKRHFEFEVDSLKPQENEKERCDKVVVSKKKEQTTVQKHLSDNNKNRPAKESNRRIKGGKIKIKSLEKRPSTLVDLKVSGNDNDIDNRQKINNSENELKIKVKKASDTRKLAGEEVERLVDRENEDFFKRSKKFNVKKVSKKLSNENVENVPGIIVKKKQKIHVPSSSIGDEELRRISNVARENISGPSRFIPKTSSSKSKNTDDEVFNNLSDKNSTRFQDGSNKKKKKPRIYVPSSSMFDGKSKEIHNLIVENEVCRPSKSMFNKGQFELSNIFVETIKSQRTSIFGSTDIFHIERVKSELKKPLLPSNNLKSRIFVAHQNKQINPRLWKPRA